MHWKSDILTEFDPFETGLERFVKLNKGDFIGKDALEKLMVAGQQHKLVTLVIDAKHAPAHGGASVRLDGRIIGTVTSGDWGHRVDKNLAYAFIEPEFSQVGTTMTVDIIGEAFTAEVIESGPYDPEYSRIRS